MKKTAQYIKMTSKTYLFWTVFTCKQCLNCAYIFRRDVSLKLKNVLMDNKTAAFCFARHSLINGVVLWIIVMFLSAVGTFFLTALDQICFQLYTVIYTASTIIYANNRLTDLKSAYLFKGLQPCFTPQLVEVRDDCFLYLLQNNEDY